MRTHSKFPEVNDSDSKLRAKGYGFEGLGLRSASYDPTSKGSSEMLTNYKDLKVWQKSYRLCLNLYRVTRKFPKEERYGLTPQIRRAGVSIPSDIATCAVSH